MEALLENLKQSYDLKILVCIAAFVLGIIFGWLAEVSRFCLRAAVAEWVKDDASSRPYRSVEYLTAMLSSLIVVQLLMVLSNIDFNDSIYRTVPFQPAALIVGGLAFGVGMALAGGCVSRLMILAGSGNLRSWFTLIVLGIAGYATLKGVLAYPRIALEEIFASSTNTLDSLMGQPMYVAALLVAIPLVAGLFVLVRRTGIFYLWPGIAIGFLVGVGWWITGILGADEFEPTPLASLSYTAPVGEGLQYLMTFTGDTLRFGIALAAGVILGAMLSAVINGRFKFIGFQYDKAPLRYALGGALMGFGGITGLGCPMGQGITGTGTLAIGSFLMLFSIIVGAGLFYYLEEQSKTRAQAETDNSLAKT